MKESKTDKKLKTKSLVNPKALTSSSYTQSYTHKNPNEYNGEVLDNQLDTPKNTNNKKVYIESYGCQMNFSDSEVVASILAKEGYQTTPKMETGRLNPGQHLLH